MQPNSTLVSRNPIELYSVPLFSIVEKRERSRLHAFIGSYALQVMLLLGLALISFTTPKLVQQIRPHVELIAPLTPQLEQQAVKLVKPVPFPPRIIALPAQEIPKIQAPAPIHELAKVPEPTLAPPKVAPVPAQLPRTAFDTTQPAPQTPAPPKVVATNVLGSSATPTVAKEASKVQTGGFGDPYGVAPSRNPREVGVAITAAGSFDLPTGSGHGNGTGGRSGTRGTIRSTGFGDGVAAPRPEPVQRGQVEQSTQFNFAAAEKKPVIQQQHSGRYTPVTVISKPVPVYTEEARRLHIEGEVLVKVVFLEYGQVRVLGIEQGLGHGLDEAAKAAAQKVKFTPAQRDGAKVDSDAVLHVVFALS